MSFNDRNSISEEEAGGNGGSTCCSTTSQLRIYQAFIFSVPIFFTFILLFLFYWFYLRRRRADWSSLRMRANNSALISESGDDISRCELGLKKELREMLPIIVFNESFSVRDTQCSVCLGEYQADDRLQQIPACGHTFHMDCIDLWLTTHTTCPLCRQSLLASSKLSQDVVPDAEVSSNNTNSNADQVSHQNEGQIDEDRPRTSEQSSEGGGRDERAFPDDQDTRCDETEGEVDTVK